MRLVPSSQYSVISIQTFLVFLPTTYYLLPTTVHAQTPTPVQIPPHLGPGPAGLASIQELIVRIISISVGLAFVALVVMLFWGGIKFMISGGDAKGIQSATQTLTYAVIGIVMMVGAWLILKLIAAFTGVNVVDFCLGFAPYCVR
jgi:hypothetical protein